MDEAAMHVAIEDAVRPVVAREVTGVTTHMADMVDMDVVPEMLVRLAALAVESMDTAPLPTDARWRRHVPGMPSRQPLHYGHPGERSPGRATHRGPGHERQVHGTSDLHDGRGAGVVWCLLDWKAGGAKRTRQD